MTPVARTVVAKVLQTVHYRCKCSCQCASDPRPEAQGVMGTLSTLTILVIIPLP